MKRSDRIPKDSDSISEGVIRFTLNHRYQPFLVEDLYRVNTLLDWRQILFDHDMIGGGNPSRYNGLGFGNLSLRVDQHRFIITSSQTGSQAQLTDQDLTMINQYSLTEGAIQSVGLKKPSSETLTHAAIYACSPSINWIFHVHSPSLWNNYVSLGIPSTPEGIQYGTIDMACAAQSLLGTSPEQGVLFAMGGHTDGMISCAGTAQKTGELLLHTLEKSKHLTKC